MEHKRIKRGRPVKPEGEARTLSLPPVRVNAAELSLIEHQAQLAGMTVSSYIRAVVTQRRVAPAKSDIDDKLLLELNRIGVNLNQLMRQINTGRDLPASAEHVLAELHIALTNVSAAYDT